LIQLVEAATPEQAPAQARLFMAEIRHAMDTP